jgi:hypothetical protein
MWKRGREVNDTRAAFCETEKGEKDENDSSNKNHFLVKRHHSHPNKNFTAKSQRTRRSHFLFGGERPPNKKASVLS